MKTVIYANSFASHPDKRQLAGVRSFAEKKQWDVLSVPAIQSPETLTRLMRMWKPAGFIVNCTVGTNIFPIPAFSGTPVVFLGRNEQIHQPGKRCLISDANAVASLAAHELISLHLKSYAYVTWMKPTYWSAARLAGFESALSLHGVKPCTFDSTLVNGDSADLIASLAEWLTGLPKPIGVFAANDRMASAVTDACMLARLTIPDDVSVVGVDNDEELCESLRPALTSVLLDFFAAGQIAAQALHRMMAKQTVKNLEAYPPLCIIRRESTRRFTRPDKIAAKALERIRREACSGLAAIDVIEMFPCSRKTAELRFKAATGNSILHEIRNVRLETAKKLLRGERLRLDRVADLCGYKSLPSFSNFFRAETGQSPSSWRDSIGT